MWSNHGSSLLKCFSVPYLLVSQNTFLISHPLTDGHLSVERTLLRLAGYEESQNGGALGPSFRQSLASDYLTSRSFCILFVPIVYSVYPRWFISYWRTFPLSLALKITPVHLLGYFLGLLGLASQCDVIESEMDVLLPSFLNTYKKLLRAHWVQYQMDLPPTILASIKLFSSATQKLWCQIFSQCCPKGCIFHLY